jgi:adenylyltransferase/sulfurtransferase
MVKDIYDQKYIKQILFEPIGLSGQNKLRKSSVSIVGCGGLGSVIASNLVRAGIGSITIIDKDVVEESNLQRQVLFNENDALNKIPKVQAAKEKLLKINSEVDINEITGELNERNSQKYLGNSDLIMDATDNFETRFLINDFYINNDIPWIYGAVTGSIGMIYDFIPGKNICLRCLFRETIPEDILLSCDTIGVINTAVNIVASIQTTEALKFLTGNYDNMVKGLISIDVWSLGIDILNISKEKGYICPVCS